MGTQIYVHELVAQSSSDFTTKFGNDHLHVRKGSIQIHAHELDVSSSSVFRAKLGHKPLVVPEGCTKWSDILCSLLDLLDDCPKLREFDIVLPCTWDDRDLFGFICSIFEPWIKSLDKDAEEIWSELHEFIRARPAVKISILCPAERSMSLSTILHQHEPHLRDLETRLGISDHRVALLESERALEFRSHLSLFLHTRSTTATMEAT